MRSKREIKKENRLPEGREKIGSKQMSLWELGALLFKEKGKMLGGEKENEKNS